MKLPFEFEYCSLVNYATKGECEVSSTSRRIVEQNIKRDKGDVIDSALRAVKREYDSKNVFHEIFSNSSILVPVPPRTKLLSGGLNIPLRISEGLIRLGLGKSIAPIVVRTENIRSSRFSGGNRPEITEHLKTLSIEKVILEEDTHFVLIDDVVSKGRTLTAAAIKLKETYPFSTIRAFSLARTLGYVKTIDKYSEPYLGKIIYDGVDAERTKVNDFMHSSY